MLLLISSKQLVKHLSGLANDVLNYPAVSKCWHAEKKNYTEVNLYNEEPTLMLSLDSHTSVCVSIGNVIIPYNKHI